MHCIKEKLVFSLKKPKREEHQENQDTSCSEQKTCHELLNWLKKQHVDCYQEIKHIQENECVYSFVHLF
jgi:hypothetical protein